jgi:hypothetical protein
MFYKYLAWYPERNCSGGRYLMTRGRRPVAAIAEAKRMATAWGIFPVRNWNGGTDYGSKCV